MASSARHGSRGTVFIDAAIAAYSVFHGTHTGPVPVPDLSVPRQVGLDGLYLLAPDTQRELRKFPLQHISRWALRGSSLVLYTKTPVDVEEHTVTLQADDRTICSVLDTLTCSCMQCVPNPSRITFMPLDLWHPQDNPSVREVAPFPANLMCIRMILVGSSNAQDGRAAADVEHVHRAGQRGCRKPFSAPKRGRH